jgi:hypothetical protein
MKEIKNKENLVFTETDEERKKVIGRDRPFSELPMKYEHCVIMELIASQMSEGDEDSPRSKKGSRFGASVRSFDTDAKNLAIAFKLNKGRRSR